MVEPKNYKLFNTYFVNYSSQNTLFFLFSRHFFKDHKLKNRDKKTQLISLKKRDNFKISS